MQNKQELLRSDGYYYQVFGDKEFGRIRIVDGNGNFIDSLGMSFKNFYEAHSVTYLLADAFNKGFKEGVKSGSFYM